MTIKDIAKTAGVSVATVSRVLNNSGYVSEDKKKLINKIIEESGYCPSAAARNLSENSSDAIGLVMPERVNPFFMKIYDAVASKADEKKLSVLFFSTEDNEKKQTEIINYLKSLRIKGLLITPGIYHTEETIKALSKLEESGIPVVLIDRNLDEGEFDAVLINNSESIRNATQALINEGHRNIGVIVCPESERKGATRYDGYLSCMRENKIAVNEKLIYNGNFSKESGYEACRGFMGLKEDIRPTAIIAFSSSAMIGAMKFFNESDYKLGRDIKLIGFDDIGTVSDIGFDVSIIERPMRIMGEMAFELLLEKTENTSRKKVKEIVLSTEIKNL